MKSSSIPRLALSSPPQPDARKTSASPAPSLSSAQPIPFESFRSSPRSTSSRRAEPKSSQAAAPSPRPTRSFGLKLQDYEELFIEKLDLLLKIRDNVNVTWSGKHRPALHNQAIYPRPLQEQLPIWLGVGGTPQSFARAGYLGLPLMVAIIGGQQHRFRPLIDLYREAGARAGHAPEKLKVGLHMFALSAKPPSRPPPISTPATPP